MLLCKIYKTEEVRRRGEGGIRRTPDQTSKDYFFLGNSLLNKDFFKGFTGSGCDIVTGGATTPVRALMSSLGTDFFAVVFFAGVAFFLAGDFFFAGAAFFAGVGFFLDAMEV